MFSILENNGQRKTEWRSLFSCFSIKLYNFLNSLSIDCFISICSFLVMFLCFISQCIFDLIPRQLNEFVERNSYQQTDPESYFRKTLMVSIPTTVGRISMVQNDLVTTENWVKRSERIKDEATRIRVWVEKFGIVV